ncbi:hypothetical protein AVEN_254206-1 [Araneus ventricosus]|uniref:Cytochrome P450 4V2 n=1 Tax=Araneus ventricosus TaxID=182803 RepID=A0A4Y2SP98_ARAVE|nr:hypothetical protein AVEN_254206-1 [Araneus ventricosus]
MMTTGSRLFRHDVRLESMPSGWIFALVASGVRPVSFFKCLADSFNKYGNKSLYCMWILYEPFVLFSKADAVKELLKGTAINEKSWVYDFTKFLIGTGLLTSGGTKWKSRRKLLNPCFHSDILKDFQETFDKHAQKLANFFQCETENEFTYIDTPLKLSTLDMICG